MTSGPLPGNPNPEPNTAPYVPGDEADRAAFSELRKSVAEAMRIISVRKWMFFVPFCVVTSGAFVLSLYMPRRYEASTMFERRDDPVLMNLPRSGGTGAFEILRRTLIQDVTNPGALIDVVERLGLVEEERDGVSGSDSETITRRRRAIAGRIAGGLKVFFRQQSPHLDVIEIKYTTDDSETMVKVLDEVRDNYIRVTQQRIGNHLRETKDWFDQECRKRQALVDQLDADQRSYKAEHRGLDPLNPEASFIELATLRSDMADLERKGRDLSIRLEGRRRLIEAGSPVGSAEEKAPNRAEPARQSSESLRLSGELRRIESRIEELISARGMTDLHPEIVELRNQRNRVALSLKRQQAQDTAVSMVNGVGLLTLPGWPLSPSVDPPVAAPSRADSEIMILRRLLANNEAEIQRQQDAIEELEALQASAVEHRQEYTTRQARINHAREDLALYRRYADQIGRLLSAENSRRGILFEKIKPASGGSIPISPRVSIVILLTLVAGLVSGVVMVLLGELFDRTIHTCRQITRVLGLPILESIDEIVSTASRRRRFLIRGLLVPAVATLMIGVVFLSGSMAYLSLEHRLLYERAIAAPGSVLNRLVEGWGSAHPVAVTPVARQEWSG